MSNPERVFGTLNSEGVFLFQEGSNCILYLLIHHGKPLVNII